MDVQTLNHMPGFARVACDKTDSGENHTQGMVKQQSFQKGAQVDQRAILG